MEEENVAVEAAGGAEDAEGEGDKMDVDEKAVEGGAE